LETPERLPEPFRTLPSAQTGTLTGIFSAKLHGINLSPPKTRACDFDDELDTQSHEILESSHFDVHEFSRTASLHHTQSSQPPPNMSMPSALTNDGLLLEHRQVASAVPPGYTVLEESARLDMLDTLQDKLDDLNRQYEMLPLRIETATQCNMQKELRTKIAEAEAAVKLFSRPGLLIEK
jgi:hypothetical protein